MLSSPTATLRISVQANVPSVQVRSPCVVLLTEDRTDVLGRTETAWRHRTPAFRVCIEVPFVFEAVQPMVAVVIDDDGSGKGQTIFDAPFKLSSIVTSPKYALTLQDGESTVTLIGEVLGADANDLVEWQFRAEGLPSVVMRSPDAYLTVRRQLSDGTLSPPLFVTETVQGSSSPVWQPLPPLRRKNLASSMDERCLWISVMDRGVLRDSTLGTALVTMEELRAAQQHGQSIKLGEGGAMTGQLWCVSMRIVRMPPVTEFLSCGWRLQSLIGIDFTESNGAPSTPQSLHCAGAANQYEQSIRGVCRALEAYSTEVVGMLGFGGIPKNSAEVLHAFPLSGTNDIYVRGVNDAVENYRRARTTVQLSSPTFLAPLIRLATVEAKRQPNVYTVLIVLTDGEMADVDETRDAVIEADDAPLSIVVVGIGRCEFSSVTQLVAAGGLMASSTGRRPRRAAIHFTAAMEYVNVEDRLAQEILRVVPQQLVEWASIAGVLIQ